MSFKRICQEKKGTESSHHEKVRILMDFIVFILWLSIIFILNYICGEGKLPSAQKLLNQVPLTWTCAKSQGIF